MNKFSKILNLVKEQRNFDFTGSQESMLERRIQKRIHATNNKNIDDYFEYLNNNSAEIDNLIDVLTINVSRFFRNSLSFEYISSVIIPKLIFQKVQANENSLRIWSAGCSYGEEPYSIAIIFNEFLNKEKISLKLNIFATDIDKKALKHAAAGKYDSVSIKNIKYALLDKYFTQKEDYFTISSEIKRMVQFSFFDLLDKNHHVPQESIFGDFDLVLCRNVLIYFNPEYQKNIFNKLYKSMNKDSYLVLGESEVPVEAFKKKFKRVNNITKIYRKVGE
ncbi:MAG: protein-glutamate O-methyltransferase CheR [Bacteroidales bacterium]|jgi:chemotaxis protein methyltransferase CheR|nr:protein-glutamate O-methyltransferase CheR [Bacteroidales bacterium]